MSAAKKIQQEREAKEMENHRERLVWLTQENPCWVDGTPVDTHTKNVLLRQSKDAVAAK